MTASSEPTGSKFIKISAPEFFSESSKFFESGDVFIISFTNLPTPSLTTPGSTITPVFGTSENFNVLLGSANIASLKSLPTFDSLIS